MWTLVGVILASPEADSHPRIGAALAIVILSSVLLGARLAGNQNSILRVGVPLACVWIVARLLKEFGNGQLYYNHLAHAAGFALSCGLLWAMLGLIRDTPKVSSSVIAEAVMIYLVIAIAFSQLDSILNECVRHPFNQTIASTDSSTLLYFSMVTLTGVGYGGIFPVDPFVRLVAVFESMVGIFYIAVIVARLVSAYRPRASSSANDDWRFQ